MVKPMARGLSVCTLVAALLLTARAVGADDVAPKNDAAPEGIAPELLEAVPPELRYERVPVPDEKNARPLWEQASEKVVRSDRFFEEFEGPEHRYFDVISGDAAFPVGEEGRPLRQWIEANTEALDLLKQGLARGQYQGPEVLGTGAGDSPGFLGGIEEIHRVSLTRAKMHADDGEFDAAVEAVAEVVSLSEMFQASGTSLLDYLVGLALEKQALAAARWLALQESTPESAVLELISAIRPAAKRDEALAQALRCEFHDVFLWDLQIMPDDGRWMKDMLSGEPLKALEAARAVAGENLPFDKRATVELGARYFLRALNSGLGPWKEADRAIEKDWEEEYKTSTDELEQALEPLLRKRQRPETEGATPGVQRLSEDEKRQMAEMVRRLDNPCGKLFADTMLPSLGTLAEMSFYGRSEREATRAFLALRAHDLRKGRLPESLDELVEEEILPVVPVDMFSGEPLRYDAERRLLWSVGPDAVDDDGKSEPGQWVQSQPDLVLSIPE